MTRGQAERVAQAGIDVGDGIRLSADSWNFDQAAEHFDQHVLRSVPHLEEQREYVGRLARFFLHQGARAYELGVSTGRLAQSVLGNIPGRELSYVGIDISPAMVERARVNLCSDPRFSARVADALELAFEPAALVLCFYTLQFIPVPRREELLRKIHHALEPGGALVLYEKTLASHPMVQNILSQLYAGFKLEQGFTPDEVIAKARSLQGVADARSSEWNKAMLKRCGFGIVEGIFRSHAFEGYLAVKEDA